MPNWCKGNIRLRGEQSSIIAFLKNEISFIGNVRGTIEAKELEPACRENEDEFIISYPEGAEELYWTAFRIKGTRRNFIDSKTIEYLHYDEDNGSIDVFCMDDFTCAWGIDAEPYVEKAKKYGIDIKIIGYEKGMMFRQGIEIVNGVLVKNEETSWKNTNDWYWNAEQPNWGG